MNRGVSPWWAGWPQFRCRLPRWGRRRDDPRVPLRDWAELWTDLASYLKAGIPLDDALDVIAVARTGPLSTLLLQWRDGLREGRSLSELYEEAGQYPLWLPLIRVGEATGEWVQMMTVLGGQAAQWDRHWREMWRQLAYPLFVTVAATGVCILFLVVVLPKLKDFYQPLGLDPGIDLEAIRWAGGGLGALAAAALGLALWLWAPGRRQRRGRELSAPVPEGMQGYSLSRRSPLRRCAQTLGLYDAFTFEWSFLVGTMLAAGVSLEETLAHLGGLRTRVSGAARYVRQRMAEGESLSETLGRWPQCTEELRRVVGLALGTGQMDRALLVLAERIAARQRRRTELWIRWLEPALTGVIGVLILGIFVLLYLPITKLMGRVVS
ncbi:type II secretion system F family protein [Kyrpidia spormannii]|uniref:type II secretion system F family protein n=1 Tax=Kyrpidia spormannii TaxID=2055160 RepID=UPI0014748E71|nr:type II secretion system F family protein [Kyrpidia spormannii]